MIAEVELSLADPILDRRIHGRCFKYLIKYWLIGSVAALLKKKCLRCVDAATF
jgi:hypothetical protein